MDIADSQGARPVELAAIEHRPKAAVPATDVVARTRVSVVAGLTRAPPDRHAASGLLHTFPCPTGFVVAGAIPVLPHTCAGQAGVRFGAQDTVVAVLAVGSQFFDAPAQQGVADPEDTRPVQVRAIEGLTLADAFPAPVLYGAAILVVAVVGVRVEDAPVVSQGIACVGGTGVVVRAGALLPRAQTAHTLVLERAGVAIIADVPIRVGREHADLIHTCHRRAVVDGPPRFEAIQPTLTGRLREGVEDEHVGADDVRLVGSQADVARASCREDGSR